MKLTTASVCELHCFEFGQNLSSQDTWLWNCGSDASILCLISNFSPPTRTDLHHPSAPNGVEKLSEAVTHARFVGTNPASDEVVLMKILQVSIPGTSSSPLIFFVYLCICTFPYISASSCILLYIFAYFLTSLHPLVYFCISLLTSLHTSVYSGVAHINAESSWHSSIEWVSVWDYAVRFQNLLRDTTQR